MDIQLGTDEAGYGPNLGPLTVTGTCWHLQDSKACLYELLSDAVSDQPAPDRITLADSKVVYRSGGSIAALETSVLATLYSIHDEIPNSWQDLIALLCDKESLARENVEAWNSTRELKLPMAADVAQIKTLGTRLRYVMQSSTVQLGQVRCVPVFPSKFNASIAHLGNKATLLSQTTLQLVHRLMSGRKFGTARVVCDKHGGRSKYAALIQHWLTDHFVRVETESLDVSSYRWNEENQGEISIHFVARGESFLPTALASMVSKYVREVFMRLWNDFWIQHIPEISPTKGYPLDAKRFKREIAQVQQSLGISDDSIWRNC